VVWFPLPDGRGSETDITNRILYENRLCHSLSNASGDGLESLLDILGSWPGYLFDHLAIAQEDQGRPAFHPKGPAERPPLTVLDLEVADVRKLAEQGRQLRP
jgi:hypothetical protein